MRNARLAASFTLALLLGACAQVRVTGRDFPLQPFNAFVLRKTTDQEVRAALGEPFQSNLVTQTVTNPNAPFPLGSAVTTVTLKYQYITSNGGPQTAGRPALKMASFLFVGGIMLSDIFVSTFPDEPMQSFDESKVSLLHQGQTTRRQVLEILGTPNGQAVPLVPGPKTSGKALYLAIHQDGQQLHNRLLVIDFDSAEVLKSYSLSDQQGPLPMLPQIQQGISGPAYIAPPVYVPPVKSPSVPHYNYHA